jgi:PilZ domain
MRPERRRTSRYPFVASVEITDEKENSRTSSKISELSKHGCYVELKDPFPEGTNVVLEIYTDAEFLETQARVTYAEPKKGMGLVFEELPSYFTGVLSNWLAQAKGKQVH